jgi:glycosyltransferase involved in cell wall biosynthesis
MRVLHIGKFFPPHAGGIERYSADLITALAARGVATAMLAHAPPGTRRTQRLSANAVEITLAACYGQFIYAPVSPGFPWLLAALIARFKPDLLHIHTPNTSAFWALLLPSARRLPWILQWQSDVPLDVARSSLRIAAKLYRPWETALLRHSKAIIASSQTYADTSPSLAPWRDKVSVIPLGLPAPANTIEIYKSIQWPASGLRLLAVGRLSYYKGFDVLLHALAKLPRVSLVLIGSGECEAQLKTLAQDLGIAARVRFAGHVDDATIGATYAQAEAFCLPSIERTEAFGMVLLEAMRARLPVVASAIAGSGVGFVVADQVTGRLVAPGDAAELARALGQLADDPALRVRFGDAGFARWQSQFNLQRCADQTVQLYRSIIEANAHPAAASPERPPSPE